MDSSWFSTTTWVAVVGVPAEDVGRIRAHGFLSRYEFQRHSQRVAEDRQVLLVSEPWGEVGLLDTRPWPARSR